jgi:TIR domain
MNSTKLFISHASEDKEDFVEPLARALKEIGFDVWYDKWMLTMGDGLLIKISEGLRQCDFGVVVLSKYFFSKGWPSEELEGLFSLQNKNRKVILPIWKDVTKAEVQAYSPILAGKFAALASNGVPSVVNDIKRAVETARTVEGFSSAENALSKFQMLDKQISGSRKAKELEGSPEGMQMVSDAVRSVISTLSAQLEELSCTSELLKFNIDSGVGDGLTVWGPFCTNLSVKYHLLYDNSISGAALEVRILDSRFESRSFAPKSHTLQKYRFLPSFGSGLKLQWRDSSKTFTTEQLVPLVLEKLCEEITKLHQRAEANR